MYYSLEVTCTTLVGTPCTVLYVKKKTSAGHKVISGQHALLLSSKSHNIILRERSLITAAFCQLISQSTFQRSLAQ